MSGRQNREGCSHGLPSGATASRPAWGLRGLDHDHADGEMREIDVLKRRCSQYSSFHLSDIIFTTLTSFPPFLLNSNADL